MLLAEASVISTSSSFGARLGLPRLSRSSIWARVCSFTLWPYLLKISYGNNPLRLGSARTIAFSGFCCYERVKSRICTFLAIAATWSGVLPARSWELTNRGSLVRIREKIGISPRSAAKWSVVRLSAVSWVRSAPIVSKKSTISKEASDTARCRIDRGSTLAKSPRKCFGSFSNAFRTISVQLVLTWTQRSWYFTGAALAGRIILKVE